MIGGLKSRIFTRNPQKKSLVFRNLTIRNGSARIHGRKLKKEKNCGTEY